MYHAIVLSCMAIGPAFQAGDVEKQAVQQLQRDKKATIRLEKGTMEIQVQEVKDGKLLLPVFTFRDLAPARGRVTSRIMKMHAKEAELVFDPNAPFLYLDVRDCSYRSSDGGVTAWIESQIRTFKLPTGR